jgi:hypothetical protein
MSCESVLGLGESYIMPKRDLWKLGTVMVYGLVKMLGGLRAITGHILSTSWYVLSH